MSYFHLKFDFPVAAFVEIVAVIVESNMPNPKSKNNTNSDDVKKKDTR